MSVVQRLAAFVGNRVGECCHKAGDAVPVGVGVDVGVCLARVLSPSDDVYLTTSPLLPTTDDVAILQQRNEHDSADCVSHRC